MLWYMLYTEKLEQEGVMLNTYDKCVANKMVNGKQCTIAWHVDDNKILHADKNVVMEIIVEIIVCKATLLASYDYNLVWKL